MFSDIFDPVFTTRMTTQTNNQDDYDIMKSNLESKGLSDMANYLMTIDPVLVLNKDELADFKRNQKKYKTTGEAADKLNQTLKKDFPFANVFQSTDETHRVTAHEFMLEDKTGDRGMHDMGRLQTPSNLMAFIAVDDDWINAHPEEAKAGAYFQMDSRIDPTQLHANDGATKDGKTTGFIRYGQYKTPVMALLPDGPLDKYNDETVEQQEAAADEREAAMRRRDFKLQAIHDAWRQAKNGSTLDGFLAGWELVSRLHNDKLETPDEKPDVIDQPHMPQMSMPGEPALGNRFEDGLKDLSAREMEMNDQMQR